eukprot:jgi/Mesvir1/10438/Mv12069-RA.1
MPPRRKDIIDLTDDVVEYMGDTDIIDLTDDVLESGSGSRIAKIALFFAIRPQSQRSGRGERAFPRPPLPRTRPQTAPLAANSAGSWAPGREGSGFSEGFFDPATRPRRSRPARQSSLSGNVASGSSMYTRANSAQGRARRKHVAPEDDDPDDPVLVFRQRADDSIPSEEPGSDAYTNTTETDPDRVEGAGGEAEVTSARPRKRTGGASERAGVPNRAPLNLQSAPLFLQPVVPWRDSDRQLSIAPDTMRRVTQRSHEDVFDEIVHPPRPGDTPEDLDRWRLFSLANLARDIYKGGVPANEASKLIGDRRRLDRMSEWHPDYNKLSRSVKRQEAKLRSQSGEGPSNVEILDHDEIPDLPEHIRRMLTDPTTRDLMSIQDAMARYREKLALFQEYARNHPNDAAGIRDRRRALDDVDRFLRERLGRLLEQKADEPALRQDKLIETTRVRLLNKKLRPQERQRLERTLKEALAVATRLIIEDKTPKSLTDQLPTRNLKDMKFEKNPQKADEVERDRESKYVRKSAGKPVEPQERWFTRGASESGAGARMKSSAKKLTREELTRDPTPRESARARLPPDRLTPQVSEKVAARMRKAMDGWNNRDKKDAGEPDEEAPEEETSETSQERRQRDYRERAKKGKWYD